MKLRPIGAGVAGGLLAGAAIGAIEALASWWGAHGAGELPAVAWGLVVYGAIGALGGLGLGLVAADAAHRRLRAGARDHRRRARVRRRAIPHRPRRLPRAAPARAAADGRSSWSRCSRRSRLAFALWRWLRGADGRRGWLTRPGVAAGAGRRAGGALGGRQPRGWRGSAGAASGQDRGGAAGCAQRDPPHGRHAARRPAGRIRLPRGPHAAYRRAGGATACASRTPSRRRRGRDRRSRRS